jgi:hypothetical protein
VESPKESMTSTGSTSMGAEQYCANMVTTVLSTTLALVRSVAVHSMNTSLVLREICSRGGGECRLQVQCMGAEPCVKGRGVHVHAMACSDHEQQRAASGWITARFTRTARGGQQEL